MRTVISLIQALLFIISSFSVQDSNFKFLVDRAAYDIAATSEISFEALDAKEYAVSEEEKQNCRNWYNQNILTAENPAYTFSLGGKKFDRDTKNWDVSIGKESEINEVYSGGKTTYINLTHKKSGIVATVEATIYEEFASCDWTVYIKNTANENSPVVSDFYAADCVLPTGKNTQAYFNKGSEPAADDFELLTAPVSILPMKYTANGGRTESFLPYFNLHGADGGVAVAVGWSGQWFVSLAQTLNGTKFKAKQENLKGYLEPGEEIRSPLVSLTFYDSSSALKGFNAFRNFTKECVYPENTTQVTTSGIGLEFPESTIDSLLANIASLPEWFTEAVDYYWIDANWFPMTNGWYNSVGNWYPDPAKFNQGFKVVSDAANEKGIGWLQWYEVERCCTGTDVYNECVKHDGWLIESDDESRHLVNLANEDCLEYITNLVLDSIEENGVNFYRIDCAISHLSYWQEADKRWENGRKGITENHYVTNFYGFLDTLLEIPDMRIDNCCSGGKRLDIEMSRRSIPLWRTDYNCMDENGNSKPDILQATQAQTYGISFWLHYSGTCAYIEGEYADRTNILPCSQRLGYQDIRPHMNGNYYPLTYGGLDTSKYLAMQFDTDAKSGMALIYKRENVNDVSYLLKLNGLKSDAVYEIYNYDTPDVKAKYTGKQLMTEGIELTINETPKAVIMIYDIAE